MMNRKSILIIFAIATILCVLSKIVCAGQMLGDHGFELSTSNGTFPDSGYWKSAKADSRAGACCVANGVANHTGTKGLWNYTGTDSGTLAWWSAPYQEFLSTSGNIYNASAWIKQPDRNPYSPFTHGWVTGSEAFVVLEFLNASRTPIGSVSSNLRITSDNQSWTQSSINNAIAPAKTAYVRFACRIQKPNGSSGVSVACFDDCSFYSIPILSWTDEPNYTSDGLYPQQGLSTETTFVYRVNYKDIDNNPPNPGYPKVHILKDNTIYGSFTMEYVSGSYSTGAIFERSITLSAGTDYSYYFEAYDFCNTQAIGTPTETRNGPVVNASPTLAWTGETDYIVDGLHPEEGIPNQTTFIYRVKYQDADNNQPTDGYPKVHILKDNTIYGSFTMAYVSGSYSTGAIFERSITLPAGTDYSYYFEAYDFCNTQAIGTPTETRNGHVVNTSPTLAWTGEPNYESDGVHPEKDTALTEFIFRIKYIDIDNHLPKSDPKVHILKGTAEISGSPFSMRVFDNGIYTYPTKLPTGKDFKYWFEVCDEWGAKATTALIDAPEVTLYVDIIGTPTFGISPLTVNFTDLSVGSVTTWFWDFGDEDYSNVQNPIHAYEDAGTYTVFLLAGGQDGTVSIIKTDYITVHELPSQPPTASITSITPTMATYGTTVDFVGTGTDADGTITAYLWQSDIAGTLSQLAGFGTSTLAVGTHSISFSVCDNLGSWSTPATATLIIISVLSGEVVTLLDEPVTGPMIIVMKGIETMATTTVTEGKFAIFHLPCKTYTVDASAFTTEGVMNSIWTEIEVPMVNFRFTLPVGYRLSSITGMIPAKTATKLSSAMALQEDTLVGLYLEDRLIATTKPDISGNFEFKGLLPAKYTIKIAQNGSVINEKNIILGKEEALEVEFSQQVESNILNVFAYPNPTNTNRITIRFDCNEELLDAKINIYNIAGELVKEIGYQEINCQQPVYTYTWHLDNIASGIYLYQVAIKTKEGKEYRINKKLGVIK
ncbi:MAG: PKD domain-containing protein [Candidatus Desantisbacteria bacterium]